MEIEAVEKIFQKKLKKSEPLGAFLERYLFGAILANYRLPERKIEKSLKKRHHWRLFWKDTCLAGSVINSDAGKEIIGKMENCDYKLRKAIEIIKKLPNAEGFLDVSSPSNRSVFTFK